MTTGDDLEEAYSEGYELVQATDRESFDMDEFRRTAEWNFRYRPLLRRLAGFRDDGYNSGEYGIPPSDGFEAGKERFDQLLEAFKLGARDALNEREERPWAGAFLANASA